MNILQNGGIIMYFIFALAVLGLYAILERWFYFLSRERRGFYSLDKKLKTHIENKEIKDAIYYLNNNRSSTSKVLREILKYGYKEKKETLTALEEKGKEVALSQIQILERNMWIISMVAHTAPLLGLLGTVTGMIKAFQAVAIHGTGNPAVLANGISEALYTTAGGLVVAIPAMIIYNYYNKKIDTIVSDMEKTSTELLNYFRK